MSDYPPYVDAYGSISKLLDAIVKAAVPPKFTQDFISSVLGLKSTSYRAMIPLLKRLNFIDQANVPTDAYKKYRDESQSRQVLGVQVKNAYSDLYKAHEYAHKLQLPELQTKLRTVLGVGEDDLTVPKVAQTFLALAKLSDFDAKAKPIESDVSEERPQGQSPSGAVQVQQIAASRPQFGLSYTINLNLPATTEVEVFNAIFRSLKEHILS